MMMMMMMMSPLCLSLVLIVFLKFVCRPSWLAVLLCEVLALLKKHVKKGMQPRCWTKKKKKGMWEEGYAGWRAVGPSLMAINVLGPFVTVSVVSVVVVSVLMFLSIVLARTIKNEGLK